MTRKLFKSYYLVILIILTSCKLNTNTLEKENGIKALGNPMKIEYFKHLSGQAFKINKTPEFIITDKYEIQIAIAEILNADNPEPWKGAGWDRIVLTYYDSIININTNSKKIGFSASGYFYSLKKNNFITKRISDK